jgi:hypothetical protein
MTTTLLIDEAGTLELIYADDLRPLLDLGCATITRASFVEPTLDGRWTADLSPVGGPTLGPFLLRDQALREERTWLDTYHLAL